jgi:hypothetical protein
MAVPIRPWAPEKDKRGSPSGRTFPFVNRKHLKKWYLFLKFNVVLSFSMKHR